MTPPSSMPSYRLVSLASTRVVPPCPGDHRSGRAFVLVRDVRLGFRGLWVEGVGRVLVGVLSSLSPDGRLAHGLLDQREKSPAASGEKRSEVRSAQWRWINRVPAQDYIQVS